jgi:hypothetical protein
VVLAAAGGALALTPGTERQTAVTPAAGAGPSLGTLKLGFTDKQLIHALEAALPAGRFSKGNAQLASGSANTLPSSQASVVFDDGAGAAYVLATVGRTEPALGSEVSCEDANTDSCVITSRPDGSRVVEMTAHGNQVLGGPATDTMRLRQVQVEYPDGRESGLLELNAPDKNGPVTRTDPPLSLDQLLAAAEDQKAWAPIFAGSPLPQSTPLPPWEVELEREQAWQRLDGMLESLLPTDLHVSNAGGRTGQVSLFVDDGHGAGLVHLEITSQLNLHTKGGTTTVEPDGTKLVLIPDSKWDPNALKGVRADIAEALRPDGTAVVVTSYNSAGPDAAPTRPAPALTMDQLKTIVLSPKWPTLPRH